MASRRWVAELLYAWFHELGPGEWWGGSEAVDAWLRRRFGRDLAVLHNRPACSFLTDPMTARAAILLFDQIPRNIHRGMPAAFAADPLARQIARGMVARGWDRAVDSPWMKHVHPGKALGWRAEPPKHVAAPRFVFRNGENGWIMRVGTLASAP